ncbi:MAG: hypothetical protein HKN10_18250 [Myxococcales bacterium]|nr:hypothetical protein [Deltaproteobacteria bacterium]NNE20412.1 hypothetical protein [Myxococcales bacterium]
MEDERQDLSRLFNRIERPVVCSRCADEVAAGQAGAVSMQEYARLDVGFSPVGLQVWCRRHSVNVVHLDFGGHRLPADFRCIERPAPDAIS